MTCSLCNKHIGDKYHSINGLSQHFCRSCKDELVNNVKENVIEAIPLIETLGLVAEVDDKSLIVKNDSAIYEYGLDSTTLFKKTPEEIYKKVHKDIINS